MLETLGEAGYVQGWNLTWDAQPSLSNMQVPHGCSAFISALCDAPDSLTLLLPGAPLSFPHLLHLLHLFFPYLSSLSAPRAWAWAPSFLSVSSMLVIFISPVHSSPCRAWAWAHSLSPLTQQRWAPGGVW